MQSPFIDLLAVKYTFRNALGMSQKIYRPLLLIGFETAVREELECDVFSWLI